MHPLNIAVTVAVAMGATALPSSLAPGPQSDLAPATVSVSLVSAVHQDAIPAVEGGLPGPAAVETVAHASVRQAFELLPAEDQVHLAQILKNLDQGLL